MLPLALVWAIHDLCFEWLIPGDADFDCEICETVAGAFPEREPEPNAFHVRSMSCSP
jgi:hypothetical protein